MTSWIFFSFYNGLHSGFIYLEMAIIGSCRLQSVGHIGQFNFLCNVMTLLLGSTSNITSGTSYESHVVILSLWYCTEHDKICGNQERSLFTGICNLLERQTAHAEVISVTWHFKQITQNTWTHHSGNRRWLRNYSDTVCTMVNFIQLGFMTVSLYLFAFSSTVKVTMYGLCVCA